MRGTPKHTDTAEFAAGVMNIEVWHEHSMSVCDSLRSSYQRLIEMARDCDYLASEAVDHDGEGAVYWNLDELRTNLELSAEALKELDTKIYRFLVSKPTF